MMTDFTSLPEIGDLHAMRRLISEFNGRRNWEAYHTPKNLATSILLEAAELAEHFQWSTPEQSYRADDAKREAIAQEIADVLIYLDTLAAKFDIDLLTAVRDKLQCNHARYPEPGAASRRP